MAIASVKSPVIERAAAWAAEPDISARSALATILGDTVAPLGGTIWLTDLITMAGATGFNERLVRTSLFRLAAEGWVDNKRVGRRSQYSLTELGRRETDAAEARIYRSGHQAWDGSWTLVFLGSETGETDDRLTRLRWRGFARMGGGVVAKPNDHATETAAWLASLTAPSKQAGAAEAEAAKPDGPAVAVAVARFDHTGPDPATGLAYRDDSGLAEAEQTYQRFLDRYRWVDELDLGRLEPIEAFALRTMIVHDLRRARLRDPDLPAPLLADDWIGHRAIDRAGSIYQAVTDQAWTWATETTDLTIDRGDPQLAARFAPNDATKPGANP